MKTFLPQNKFYSASSNADEAGASTSAPLSNGASAALSVSDGVPWSSLDLEMWPTVTLAHTPSETEGAVSRAASSDNFEDDLERLLGVAGKRRRLKLPRFVPDYEGMEAAINDPGSPRLRADDPTWADASPLFLRDTA